MLKKTSARKLLKLAAILDELPPERFYYGQWVGNDSRPWRGKQTLSCGTTACALGWGAVKMPELKLTLRRSVALPKQGFVARKGTRVKHDFDSELSASLDAGAKAFGITTVQAEELFLPYDANLPEDAPPKTVAAHIRRCVRVWSRTRES